VGRQRVSAAARGGERRSIAWETRKCAPDLGFEHGLHWEIAGSTGNSSEGFGGCGIGRSGGTAASDGSGSTARPCGRGEARERKRSGGRVFSPRCEAPGAFVHRRGAVKRRRTSSRSLTMAAAVGLGMLGFCERRRRLRLGGEELGYGRLNRGGCGSWACGPEAAHS
jgi:hypothetical protein